MGAWVKYAVLATLAVEQEIAHVEAEGAADVATAVGQGTGQAAAVEWTKCVRTMETNKVQMSKL